jgi:hypothetical protein
VLHATLERLSNRQTSRTEAEIQADVRAFILEAPFSLEEGDVVVVSLETPVGDKRRIDIEVGSTVIEVKRDLRRGRVRVDAVEQLAGYVQTRADQTGLRYVGILTDGVEWRCYHLVNSQLSEVSVFELTRGSSQLEELTVWLEGVLATTRGIPPTASEIFTRLGSNSSAHKLDRATLAVLYDQNREAPSVKLKRTLWSRLLTSALGTQFEDTDELFIEHTLLVNSAEIIAHALLGLSVSAISPQSLLTGTKFDESGIYGVVEADFFDWVVEIGGGSQFIKTLARRLDRFIWEHVDHDVLKVLYEAVIGTDTRQKLGEYYTPDWMAEHIVSTVVVNPLHQKVLDPACGSGTFLFHAIRNYMTKAEEEGVSLPDVINGLTRSVIGMDLHPVAVAFARVTYILAIGRKRLTDPERGEIRVPVFLGDSIQWRQQVDLLSAGSLVVQTDDQRELFTSELRFPDELLANAATFDRLVGELADKASRRVKGSTPPSLTSTFNRFGISTRARDEVDRTFKIMCQLHDQDRDHIWSYYVRNLARPIWLSKDVNRVDVVLGNPPWLAYRKMTPEMQATFRSMSVARGLWHGAEVATQQDLSGLFVARALQLYLKKGGKFAFVLPNAAVDRPQFAGLRSGVLDSGGEVLRLSFEQSWDFRQVRPHIFPRGSCVIFGTRTELPQELPAEATFWSGRVPRASVLWRDIEPALEQTIRGLGNSQGEGGSPYAQRFRNGATIFPRVLFMVEQQAASPLGTPAGRMRVQSLRSANEKKPWKEVESIQGVVESEFVRPVVTSDCLLPFRLTDPPFAVLPVVAGRLAVKDGEIDGYVGLSSWWENSSKIWKDLRSSERLELIDQLDYMHKLSQQFPISGLRVVYNKSGMHVVACKVQMPSAVIENGLYWMVPSSASEADYVCAVLNSPVLTKAVQPLMSYGKDERDVAKHVWKLPVPEYDSGNQLHIELAEIGSNLEQVAAEFSIAPNVYFPTIRRRFREALDQTPEMIRLIEITKDLLG